VTALLPIFFTTPKMPQLLHRQSFFLALLLALIVIFYIAPLASAAEGKCAGGGQFSCPNCGGILVSDCMDCDGYLFTDYNYQLCYNRKLFNTNAENGNSDNHYPFLWTDM